jgi:hypothetical protein
MAAVYVSPDTCPGACPWRDNGCYARNGRTLMAWRKVAEHGRDLAALCASVRAVPRGSGWRYGVAGDLPGDGDTIDHAALAQIVQANRGRRGFAYTHKPVGLNGQVRVNARAILASNASGLAVNLSADSLQEADRKAALGVGPVVVVLPADAPQHMRTPEGRHVTVCPAETKGLTCDRCLACARPGRRVIIGFRAHGAQRNHVSAVTRRSLPVV